MNKRQTGSATCKVTIINKIVCSFCCMIRSSAADSDSAAGDVCQRDPASAPPIRPKNFFETPIEVFAFEVFSVSTVSGCPCVSVCLVCVRQCPRSCFFMCESVRAQVHE